MTHTLTPKDVADALAVAGVAPKFTALIAGEYARIYAELRAATAELATTRLLVGEVAGLRDQLARALARAVTAEMQRDYWIAQADEHGHGPGCEDVPFAEEVAEDD